MDEPKKKFSRYKKKKMAHNSFLRRKTIFSFLSCVLILISSLFIINSDVFADPWPDPPYWDNGTGDAIHWAPVMWPLDDAWIAYTHQQIPIKDKRISDPSNGGRSPQNYANVSSSCTDQSQSSVAWAYDASDYPVFFFRWKVEQIANSYATGPSAGTYQTIDPWKEAQWSVLMDIDGDGFYDFATHIDGQSGNPSEPIDVLQTIYNTTKSQSIDWEHDANIYRLFHNPTAFVDDSSDIILNFRNINSPTTYWPNGSAETVWDYGTTRAVDITAYSPTKCIEYNVDYQIPLDMLDATEYGGPKMEADTPFCMTFVTANSNVNPLQKDVVYWDPITGDDTFLGDPDACIPCGDMITLNGGVSIPQPTVDWVKAEGCDPTTLTAQVRDALDCTSGDQDTIDTVDFYYCYDADANGEANECPDAGDWTYIGFTSTSDLNDPSKWTFTGWDTTELKNGQYLIGVRAKDDDPDGPGPPLTSNITWSYLTQAQVEDEFGVPPDPNYTNHSPKPGVVFGIFNNYCGEYAEVTKTVAPSYVSKGDTVDFTITIRNQTGSDLNVNSISDILPPNFTYVSGSTTGDFGTANPSQIGQTLTWTFVPAVTIPLAQTRQLTFTADTDNVPTGTYSNVASSVTAEEGTLTSNPVDIGIGGPRLTIAKTVNEHTAEPGDTLTYTITYSNDSPINVTGVTIVDTLPIGLNFGAATNGGTYDSEARTITWNVGNLSSGEGPYTVVYNVTVDVTASSQPQNNACIDFSENTDPPVCARAVVTIETPLKLQKSANPISISPGSQVTFTINYANAGNSPLSGTEITDVLPVGFTFVSAPATPCPVAGSYNAGTRTVTWSIGDLSAGGSDTCTLVLQANNPYTGTYPAVNTTTVTATGKKPASDSAWVGIYQGACTTNTPYYFHSAETNVGFDGTQKIADVTAPTSAIDTIIASPQGIEDEFGNPIPVEFVRFYMNPAIGTTSSITSPITVTYWAKKTRGSPSVSIEIYDYDPVTGGKNLLGSGTGSAGGNITRYDIDIAVSGSLPAGHRLLYVFSVVGNGATIDFHYDSTGRNSRAAVCLSPQYQASLGKQVDLIVAEANDPLTYTIRFGNNGSQDLTGAQIIDTLPDGVILITDDLDPNRPNLNGSPLTYGAGYACTPAPPYTPPDRPEVCTFTVNTAGAPSGQLAAGQTGTLTLTANIENPIVFDHNPLINVAELDTDQTEPISDRTTTNVINVAILGIKKRASATLLKPGDTVIFYLDVTNIGTADTEIGEDYDVIAYFDQESYYYWLLSSDGNPMPTDLDDNSCEYGEPCKITWTLSGLAAGATRTVSYTMQVSAAIDPPTDGGVPNGFTEETDHAEVSYKSDTSTSNEVIVTLYTNPNLKITKSVTTPAPYTDTIGTGNGSRTIFSSTANENVGTGDGVTTIFNNILTNIPINSGLLKIFVDGNQVGTDDGAGNVIGATLQNSTINYTTGNLYLDFTSPPSNGSAITANYNMLANTPIQRGKLLILVKGTHVGVDSGTGVIIGDNLQNSTIDYTTGAIHLEFITEPALGDTITASYNVPAIIGDELVYTITVTNIGASTATGVLVTDPIPSNASYYNGTLYYDTATRTDLLDADNGYFDSGNNRVVFEVGDLLKNDSHTMNFTIILDSPPLDGTSTTINTATASASNTASKNATATYDVRDAELIITKSAPTLVPYPLTTIAETTPSQTGITIQVVSVQYISVGDIIVFGNAAQDVRTITAVDPTSTPPTISFTGSVTVNKKEPVYPTIRYRLTYKNIGSVDATNVTVTDILSAIPQLKYIDAEPTPDSAPPQKSNGTVTWNLGTIEAGETESLLLWVLPTATGTYYNSATLRADQIDDVDSNETETEVGGVTLTKVTSTPNVVNNGGTTATYTITLTNQTATASTVAVTDILPEGFTYASTSGTPCPTPPAAGATQPTWSGCSLAANGTLSITFTANIAATVGAGTYQNPVNATSSNLFIIPFDEINTTAEDVTVTVPYDLKVTKSVELLSDPCGVDCNIVYTITVANVGTNAFTDVYVTDNLPSQVTYNDPDFWASQEGDYIYAEPPENSQWVFTGPINPASVVEDPLVSGDYYACIKNHVSDLTNQPGIGTNWQEYWIETGTIAVSTWLPGRTYNNGTATLEIYATINTEGYISNCADLDVINTDPDDTNAANNRGCSDITPTLVTLSGFRAYEHNGKVAVEWSTSSEIDTIGFYLFRLDETTGTYIRLNNKLLPGLIASRQGGIYSLIDKGIPPEGNFTYLLIEVQGKGPRIAYGPFTVEVGGDSSFSGVNNEVNPELINNYPCPTCVDQKNNVPVAEITTYFDEEGALVVTNKQNGLRKPQPYNAGDLFENYTRKAHGLSAERKATLNLLKVQKQAAKTVQATRTGDKLKIPVSTDGLYYLDAADIATLLDMNYNKTVNMIKNSQLAMQSQGQKVAYLPANDNAGIFFYGEAIDSRYAKENIYWLEKSKGSQMEYTVGKGPQPVESGTYTENLHFEEDTGVVLSISQDPDADLLFWDWIISGIPPFDKKQFTIQVNGAVNDLSTAQLSINLQSLTPSNQISISLNGEDIGEAQWTGFEQQTLTFEFDQILLEEGENIVEVTAINNPLAPYSTCYIYSFDLTYQRLYKAVGNSLIFRGDRNPIVTVSEFSNPDVIVIDVTDPHKPKVNTDTTIDETAGKYRVSIKPSSPDSVYLATTLEVAQHASAWADEPSSLTSQQNEADYIVIAPEVLADAAQTLANYRQSQSLQTMVINLEDIMDEFNYGISSPEAIHDFLIYAYQNWSLPPKYIVLAGKGTYDYKDSIGYGNNLVPTMVTGTPWGVYASDNLFADVNGDHVPEMAIGRLSAIEGSDLMNIVNKIVEYESNESSRVILLADNADDNINNNFPADSEIIASLIPAGYPSQYIYKIYLSDNINHTRLLLYDSLNGTIEDPDSAKVFLNYIGHAGIFNLADEGILSNNPYWGISNLSSLTNSYRLPIVTAMTCAVGEYALPDYETLSEAMMLKGDGGAVAFWAPTGNAFNFLSRILDREFYKAVFRDNETVLGDSILKALQGYGSSGGPTYMLDIYTLQGDPALKLK